MRTLKAAVSLILAVGCFCINLLPFSYAEFSFGDLTEYTQGTTGIFQTSFNAQTGNLITTGKTDKSDVEAEHSQNLVSTGKTLLTSAPSTGTICTTRPDGNAPQISSAKENTLPVTTKKPSQPCTSVSNTTFRQTTPSVSTDAHTSSLKTQSTSKPAQVSTTVKTTALTTTEIITQTSTAQTPQPVTSASDKRTPVTEEIRGVWVATVYRIDFPSGSKLSSKQLKNEVRELVDSLAEYGFNAVYFQVRPTSDALYKSDIFPSSHWITSSTVPSAST